MRRDLFICLLLAGITLAIYWPARNYDLYQFDDPFFLMENPEIQSGLNGHSLIWAMTGVVVGNWHPVTSLSFVLGHQFWGDRSRGGTPGERGDSRAQRRTVVSGLAPDDPVPMAERGGGRVVCVASVTGGIRGVDCGAQGRVERFFLFSDTAGMGAIRGEVQSPRSKV
jgi:hypothetical protein